MVGWGACWQQGEESRVLPHFEPPRVPRTVPTPLIYIPRVREHDVQGQV